MLGATVDDGLAFSSILREDDAIFKVFFLLLSRADDDGISRVSPDFIASITGKNLHEVVSCLNRLEMLDPTSRSMLEGGRRIEKIDGGYRIINHARYQRKAKDARERELIRERQRKHREEATDHPLVAGRKPEVISTCYRLIREISCLDPDKDPVEILLDASGWKGDDGELHTRVRLETMSDDHLIRTLTDLKANLAALQAKKGGPQ